MIGYKKNRAYYNTYLFTIGSVAANLAVSAIFSRYFETNEFLGFNIISRYFGFFIAIGSGSVGFALIYFLQKNVAVASLYGNAILINSAITSAVAIIALIYGQNLELFSAEDRAWFVFAFTWVFAQSFFHTVISLYRGLNRYEEANTMTLVIKVVLLCLAAIFCAHFEKSVYFYYGLIGVGSGLLLAYFVARLDISLLPEIQFSQAKKIAGFSLSRWGDNIVRLGFSVFVILVITLNGSVEIAGYVAILLVPLKAIESSLQPMVMIVFSKWVGKLDELQKRNVLIVLAISFAVCAFVILCIAILGEWLLTIWITDTYAFLAGPLLVLSFSFFPLITISLLRGMFEGEFRHSPSFIVNLSVLLLPAVFVWLPISLEAVVWTILLVSYLRFFLLGYIYWRKFESLKAAA